MKSNKVAKDTVETNAIQRRLEWFTSLAYIRLIVTEWKWKEVKT